MSKRVAALLVLVLSALTIVAAQERPDAAIGWRIRQEATERSQVMATLHALTDVHGPRLTGSPAIKAASEWAVQQLTSWGLSNAHLEAWDFGHPGWSNERFAGFITSPVKDSLVGEVLAWTPGTNGTVTGEAVRIEPPARPTQDAFTAFLDSQKDKVKGRIVLVGKPRVVPVVFNPAAKRREDSEVRAQYDPDNPTSPTGMPPMGPAPAAQPEAGPPRLTANEVTEQLNVFLVQQGALVRLDDAGRDHGQIRAFNNRTFEVAKAVPTVVLRSEDYGRISRLLDSGKRVELEFAIVNRTHPEGTTAHNVIAEIPAVTRPTRW